MKIRAVLIATGVLAGMSVVVPPVASAALSDCGSTSFCLWKDANYLGALYANSTTVHATFLNIVANQASSGVSNRYQDTLMWDGFYGAGGMFCFESQNKASYLGVWGWNDRVKSYRNLATDTYC